MVLNPISRAAIIGIETGVGRQGVAAGGQEAVGVAVRAKCAVNGTSGTDQLGTALVGVFKECTVGATTSIWCCVVFVGGGCALVASAYGRMLLSECGCEPTGHGV